MTLIISILAIAIWLIVGESYYRGDKFLRSELQQYARRSLKMSFVAQVMVRIAWPVKNVFKSIIRELNVNSMYL